MTGKYNILTINADTEMNSVRLNQVLSAIEEAGVYHGENENDDN